MVARDAHASGGATMREIDIVDVAEEHLEDNDDVYSDAFREELLDADEIDTRLDAFMRGYGSGWL